MSPTCPFLIYGSEPKRACTLFSGSVFDKDPEHQNQGPSLPQKECKMEYLKWIILWGQLGFTSSWIAQGGQ